MKQSQPLHAVEDADILSCFPVMQQLRPHLTEQAFVATVKALQSDGYKLLYLRNDNKVLALAGYRIAHNLFMGKHLYVDDLVTCVAERSQGHGETLLSWLRDHARQENCAYLHLDSGTHRGKAHKFYFSQNMEIASYHFSEKL